MKETVYIFSSGTLKRKDNTLFFESEEGKKFIPVEQVREILAFGEVDINKRVLEFLAQKEIILSYYNYYGYYMGSFYPREHYNSGFMVLKQAGAYTDNESRLPIARSFVEGAAKNMLKILKYYRRRKPGADPDVPGDAPSRTETGDRPADARSGAVPPEPVRGIGDIISDIEGQLALVNEQPDIPALMSVEGKIRKSYFSGFNLIIDNPEFTFEKRTKRPPGDCINALISFSNSMIYTAVLSEIYQTHLDPRIGFLHATNFRRFTLNLDVAEVFKPVIGDRTIFSVLNKGIITEKDFEKDLNGILLNEKGRRKFLEHLEERMRQTIKHSTLKRNVSYRRLMRLELYKLEKHLMGESPYKPFVMDW